MLPVIPYAQILYSMALIQKKRYNEFLGIAELFMDSVEGKTGNIRYMIPRLYYFKYLAIAKYNSGNEQEAQEYFDRALAIALADKIYLPFANQTSPIDQFLEAARRTVPDQEGLNDLIRLCKRHNKGVSVIRKAVQPARSPADHREKREVAVFARERLSAKENRRRAVHIGSHRQDDPEKRVQQAGHPFKIRADYKKILTV